MEIVSFNDGAFNTVFDLVNERTVGTYGFTNRPSTKRDKQYHSGHPNFRQAYSQRDASGEIAKGKKKDIGHLMSDRQGGNLGPNAVPQLTHINQGCFTRRWSPLGAIWNDIERYCQSNDGVFSFGRPIYSPGNKSIDPNRIEYGLVHNRRQFRVVTFPNR